MTFKGWPDAALEFYVGLEADNSKDYWHAHRATYDECVKAPFVEKCNVVPPTETRFGDADGYSAGSPVSPAETKNDTPVREKWLSKDFSPLNSEAPQLLLTYRAWAAA